MRILSLGLLTLLLLAACSGFKSVPEAEGKVVGKWKGSDMFPIEITFNKDHTATLGEDRGKWAFQDGKCLVWPEGAKGEAWLSGAFDAKGRLVLEEKSEAGSAKRPPWVLQRLEALNAPVSKEDSAAIGKALSGEWRFAYSLNSPAKLGPAFDRLAFLNDGTIRTTSTLVSKGVSGKYALNGKNLTFKDVGPKSVENKLTVRTEDNGSILMMKPIAKENVSGFFNAEWAFLRPDRFLSNEEVAGVWIDDKQEYKPYHREMELRKDGRLIVTVKDEQGKLIKMTNGNDGKNYDYYFLWNSPQGTIMTTVFINPEFGLQSLSMKIKKSGDNMVVLPVEFDDDGKIMISGDEGKETWRRKEAVAGK